MAKIIIATEKSVATAAAKKPAKKIKQASNTQVGMLRGLQKDLAQLVESMEDTFQTIGGAADDLEGSIEDATYTADGAKKIAPLLRDTIKAMKAATAAVNQVEKSFDKLMPAVIKAVHPDTIDDEAKDVRKRLGYDQDEDE